MPTHLFSKQKIHANRKVCMDSTFSSGGDKRDRTADLLNAIQALSQVSYTPTAPAPISAALFSRVLYYIIKSFLRCQPRIFNFFCEEIKQRAADGKI